MYVGGADMCGIRKVLALGLLMLLISGGYAMFCGGEPSLKILTVILRKGEVIGAWVKGGIYNEGACVTIEELKTVFPFTVQPMR